MARRNAIGTTLEADSDSKTSFTPDKFFDNWQNGTLRPPYDGNFRKFILSSFGLPPSDTYIYKAVAEISLLQAQTYMDFGAQGRLHEWYRDAEGKQDKD
ncbi:hypothetical protein LTR28_000546 [Elasticomyces elasticus]|nr:hypothetical protein LTR28_000546 [Elasticomyces elasticus]